MCVAASRYDFLASMIFTPTPVSTSQWKHSPGNTTSEASGGLGLGCGAQAFLESTFIDQNNPKRQTAGPQFGSPKLDLRSAGCRSRWPRSGPGLRLLRRLRVTGRPPAFRIAAVPVPVAVHHVRPRRRSAWPRICGMAPDLWPPSQVNAGHGPSGSEPDSDSGSLDP